MNRKLGLSMTWVIVLIGMLVQGAVSAGIAVGVEVGDWIEYNVVCTGTSPSSPYATWVKIEM
jgi:hypothetical protein